MIRNDVSFLTPEENLCFDDVLLLLAEQGQGGETLRFWEPSCYFIVLGKTSKAQEDISFSHVQKDHIPVLRRSSAGGTVLQGKGCLNFSLILSKNRHPALSDINASYSFILGKVKEAIESFHLECELYPPCDLALKKESRKFSGNAQKRGRHFILHHGTLLYNLDLSLVEKYLLFPKKTPPYRKERSHSDFLVNVPVCACSLKDRIAECFDVDRREHSLLPLQNEQLFRAVKRMKEQSIA